MKCAEVTVFAATPATPLLDGHHSVCISRKAKGGKGTQHPVSDSKKDVELHKIGGEVVSELQNELRTTGEPRSQDSVRGREDGEAIERDVLGH
jgi:hypothetical protein